MHSNMTTQAQAGQPQPASGPAHLAEAALEGAVKQGGLLGEREGQPLGQEAVRLR